VAKVAAPAERTRRPQDVVRVPLSRQRVLETALRHVDAHGLAGLTMRKLGAELGVEAMSLYRHVDGKDGLYDGIIELLWAEAEAAATPADDWQEALRRLAHALRNVVHRHPHAAPLLTSRSVMPTPALRLFDAHLHVLRSAGFDDQRAADAARTVFAFAFGFALTEVNAPGGTGSDSETQRLRRISQSLPSDVPDHLFDVAVAICNCDMNAQFELGVDVLLRGLATTDEKTNATRRRRPSSRQPRASRVER
jgi:TetR/AcrR family tetracycline transcriptional repressor